MCVPIAGCPSARLGSAFDSDYRTLGMPAIPLRPCPEFPERCRNRAVRGNALPRNLHMTAQANRRRALRETSGVEAGAMGIHPPSGRGVTRQAVALRVTCRARREALASGPPMLQQPLRLRRVEGRIQTPARSQSGAPMTFSTERLGIVACRALTLAAIPVGRVTRDEVCDMEAPGRFAGMAIGAELLGVTTRAVQGTRSGGRPVIGLEADIVNPHRTRRRPDD